MSSEPVDYERVRHFAGKVMGDMAGVSASLLAAIGDRLGLFRVLDAGGPATSAELAERAEVAERYAREWLYGLHAAGYLELDRERGRFSLPPEHAEVLARDGAPFFLAGGFQALRGELAVFDGVTEAFRSGGGVPQAAYPGDMTEGIQRFSAPLYEHQLLQQWIPAADGVEDKLEAGARYADVGCGTGHALIKLAGKFSRSIFVGYDAFEGAIAGARRAAEEAGVSERVRFELLDASSELPEHFDVISTFDVVHDAIDPAGLLSAIKGALESDGSYLMLEPLCADDPADNVGPVSTMLYGSSLMYCATTSLAHGGAGLGTCGCPPAKVRQLCEEAGFGSVRELPIESPVHLLYEIRP
jgi:SAM-dependent methyltransferase